MNNKTFLSAVVSTAIVSVAAAAYYALVRFTFEGAHSMQAQLPQSFAAEWSLTSLLRRHVEGNLGVSLLSDEGLLVDF